MSKRKPSILQDDTEDETVEPYAEPGPDADEWPTDWSPKQRSNWRAFGQPVYEQLETDAGATWYRRTWRPKSRNDGMMTRDHVKLGTPEDYVAEHVQATLEPASDLTSVMMRRVGAYDQDKEILETAIEDIAQARISCMTPSQRAQLAEGGLDLAKSHGLQVGDE